MGKKGERYKLYAEKVSEIVSKTSDIEYGTSDLAEKLGGINPRTARRVVEYIKEHEKQYPRIHIEGGDGSGIGKWYLVRAADHVKRKADNIRRKEEFEGTLRDYFKKNVSISHPSLDELVTLELSPAVKNYLGELMAEQSGGNQVFSCRATAYPPTYAREKSERFYIILEVARKGINRRLSEE